MAIRILGGRIIDPSRGIDQVGDIFIVGNTIAKAAGRQDRFDRE